MRAKALRVTQVVPANEPRIVGMGNTLATNTPFFVVTSLSEQARCHILLRLTRRLECDCLASRHGKVCSHQRLVHDFLVAETRARLPETKIIPPRLPGDSEGRDTALLRRSNRPFHMLK